jgi:hypothetical protein
MLEKNTSWVTRPALAKQRGVEQRRAAAAAQAPLVGGEEAERDRGGAQAQPRPRGPAVLAALDERQDDVDEAEGDQRGPHEIQAVGARDARLGHRARGDRQAEQADGHVDEEAAAPAETGDVGLHERAADELPADGRQPEDDPVDADRAHAVGALVDDADDRQHLRAQQRGREPLDEAGDHQHGRAGRQAARRRGGREEGEAEREHAPAAELVAEPSGGDEERGEGQAVAGDDPFDGAGAGMQIALHRRHGDVDDEEVQDDHEGAREDDGQGRPLVREQAGGPGQAGCEFLCAHDALEGASGARARRLPAR